MELITKESVEATLISEITKRNFQHLIETCKTAPITKETIKTNYPILLQLRDLHSFLESRLEEENKPDQERIDARKAAYGVYMKQIEEVLAAAEPDLISVNRSILLDEKEFTTVVDKENEIKKRHIDFVKETVHKIVVSTDNKELARIQSLIGTEKSRKAYYGEYHPNIEASCDALLGLIDEQKRIIKENAKLKKEQDKFKEKGDEPMVTELQNQILYNTEVIKENAEHIATEAFKQISSVTIYKPDIESAAIQPRTRRWHYKIIDIDKLYKEMPHLVEKVPNKKAINAFVKEKTEAGGLDSLNDNVFSGLAIFFKRFYVEL